MSINKGKTERNILVAFILNTIFSVSEFVGGFFIGSVAITSDAVHDLGDALSIGASYFLERKSKGSPDEKYTYGYARFSVLGGLITTLVLLIGSGIVIYNAVVRIINPTPINYDGMIIFALFGVTVNLISAVVTYGGNSFNQKAVNLHMIEDVLGWVVILIGAVIMRLTDLYLIDAVMSIGVAMFVIAGSVKNLKEILEIFLIKTPKNINIDEIKKHIEALKGVGNVHHMHVWTLDGINCCATMHVVCSCDYHAVKEAVKSELRKYNILHTTIEVESPGEECDSIDCKTGKFLPDEVHFNKR